MIVFERFGWFTSFDHVICIIVLLKSHEFIVCLYIILPEFVTDTVNIIFQDSHIINDAYRLYTVTKEIRKRYCVVLHSK